METTPAIEIAALHKSFGRTRALDGLDDDRRLDRAMAAVAVIGGLTAVLAAALPRHTGAAWGLLTVFLLLGQFGRC